MLAFDTRECDSKTPRLLEAMDVTSISCTLHNLPPTAEQVPSVGWLVTDIDTASMIVTDMHHVVQPARPNRQPRATRTVR